MKKTIQVQAGLSSAGQPVCETLLVEEVGPNTYELLASPGLVLGAAAGDVLRTIAPNGFEILKRGGNLCIQLFRRGSIDTLDNFATAVVSRLGGRLDGQTAKQLVYTIPVVAGFSKVEQAMREIVERFPDVEWFYGNVYDPSDGVTPLNWWM